MALEWTGQAVWTAKGQVESSLSLWATARASPVHWNRASWLQRGVTPVPLVHWPHHLPQRLEEAPGVGRKGWGPVGPEPPAHAGTFHSALGAALDRAPFPHSPTGPQQPSPPGNLIVTQACAAQGDPASQLWCVGAAGSWHRFWAQNHWRDLLEGETETWPDHQPHGPSGPGWC